jgi:hypothetical protein
MQDIPEDMKACIIRCVPCLATHRRSYGLITVRIGLAASAWLTWPSTSGDVAVRVSYLVKCGSSGFKKFAVQALLPG